MEFFSIEYRDPIFGIIILFALIFIISFMNYWWGVFKSKEEKSSIERFIKRFEISKDEDEYKMLLNDYTIPASSLTLLAHAYQKSGDFEKSIAIYLLALKRVCEKDEKEYLLYNLGKTYYKAGFMRRATEMFLEVLRLNPRNQKSLKYLTVVYEQLKEYDRALEVIDVLEELGTDVKDQKNYLKSLKIDTNNLLNDTQKLQMLKELSFEYELIQRVIFEFLLKNKLHVHYSDVDFIQPKLVMDLLWYLDDDKVELELVKEPLARAIFSAKGLGIEDEKSDIFELEVLQKLHVLGYEKATLNFSYICTSCKHSLPAFFYRCPSCHELGKITIEPILSRVSQHSDMVF